MTFDRDAVFEMIHTAYAEGYRHGYVNGEHDKQFGEPSNPGEDVTDSCNEWLQWEAPDQSGVPFPELVSRGPLFKS